MTHLWPEDEPANVGWRGDVGRARGADTSLGRRRQPEYVELHCHSYFSLLDGASSPEALVERAAALGYPALALTDHNGLYGVIRFWQAAQQWGQQVRCPTYA